MISSIYRRRWLICVMVAHQLKLRYSGSLLGFLWTLLNPLLFMSIYTLVFSIFLRFGIAKYPVFVLSGLIAWLWFSEAISLGTGSIVNGATFIKSGIFPTEILAVVSVTTAMMNFIFALPLLLIFLGVFHVDMGWSLLALPIVMVVHFILALGLVLIISTYNVFFRDLQNLIGHVLLALFFLSPVFYELTIVPERWFTILRFNPLATLISSYRSVLLYNQFPDWVNLGYLFLIALVLLWIGNRVFQNRKEVFAEYI